MTKAAKLRNSALQVLEQTLKAIDVEQTVLRSVRRAGSRLVVQDEILQLTDFSRIISIGIGKASVAMGRAIEEVLGDRLDEGLITTNAIAGELPRRLPVLLGGHPIPNEASLEAAGRTLDLLRANDAEDTLIIFLITGGGSTLFEKPVDSRITLADLQEVNRVLVTCGAVIGEMNIVRRHLSAVKGGRLAEAAPRARQVSLYISDVNSNDLTSVASGPTLPFTGTLDEFYRIVEKHRLTELFPAPVVELIRAREIPALPQEQSKHENPRSHHLLLDNQIALLEAKSRSESLGFVVEIADDLIEGEVEELARIHLTRFEDLRHRNPGRLVCLLSGGEAICPVRGSGQGGRNQEFVLRVALNLRMQAIGEVVVLSAGTDGIDGNSPAAGAIADRATIPGAEKRGFAPVDYLNNSDSYAFFSAIGDTIITGPTGNNVRDLRLLLGG